LVPASFPYARGHETNHVYASHLRQVPIAQKILLHETETPVSDIAVIIVSVSSCMRSWTENESKGSGVPGFL
jgi:hypothetical protein